MKTKAKIIAILICLIVLFEWPVTQLHSQQIQYAQQQDPNIGMFCFLVVMVVCVGGVLLLCAYLNKCYPMAPQPTTPPPTNNPAGAARGSATTRLLLVSAMSISLTNFNVWSIPYTNVWLDAGGNQYTTCFSGNTPTNLLECTNIPNWSPLNYSITGWVSSASMVMVVYDKNGISLVTNWSSITQSNGFYTVTSGTNVNLPQRYKQEFFKYVN